MIRTITQTTVKHVIRDIYTVPCTDSTYEKYGFDYFKQYMITIDDIERNLVALTSYIEKECHVTIKRNRRGAIEDKAISILVDIKNRRSNSHVRNLGYLPCVRFGVNCIYIKYTTCISKLTKGKDGKSIIVQHMNSTKCQNRLSNCYNHNIKYINDFISCLIRGFNFNELYLACIGAMFLEIQDIKKGNYKDKRQRAFDSYVSYTDRTYSMEDREFNN